MNTSDVPRTLQVLRNAHFSAIVQHQVPVKRRGKTLAKRILQSVNTSRTIFVQDLRHTRYCIHDDPNTAEGSQTRR